MFSIQTMRQVPVLYITVVLGFLGKQFSSTRTKLKNAVSV